MSESKPATAQDVYEVILRLSAEERELLSAMLDQDENTYTLSQEIKQAWVDESDRRMQLIEEGKAGWVDGEQVLRDLRQSIG
jgi:ribosome assembly protein YihI (activator of Der GTPase)